MNEKPKKQNVKLIKSPYENYGFEYDVLITDSQGKDLKLFFGGNLDLYLIPDVYEDKNAQKTNFLIENDGSLLYKLFEDLFSAEKKKDARYNENFCGEKLFYFNDDQYIEEANKIEIYKIDQDKKGICLDFIWGKKSIHNFDLDIRLRCSGARNEEFVYEMLKIYKELKQNEKNKLKVKEDMKNDELQGMPWLDLEF